MHPHMTDTHKQLSWPPSTRCTQCHNSTASRRAAVRRRAMMAAAVRLRADGAGQESSSDEERGNEGIWQLKGGRGQSFGPSFRLLVCHNCIPWHKFWIEAVHFCWFRRKVAACLRTSKYLCQTQLYTASPLCSTSL